MEDQSSEVNRQCRDSSALHSKYILTLHFKYILLELKGKKNPNFSRWKLKGGHNFYYTAINWGEGRGQGKGERYCGGRERGGEGEGERGCRPEDNLKCCPSDAIHLRCVKERQANLELIK